VTGYTSLKFVSDTILNSSSARLLVGTGRWLQGLSFCIETTLLSLPAQESFQECTCVQVKGLTQKSSNEDWQCSSSGKVPAYQV
jgi:hypothetical protein